MCNSQLYVYALAPRHIGLHNLTKIVRFAELRHYSVQS